MMLDCSMTNSEKKLKNYNSFVFKYLQKYFGRVSKSAFQLSFHPYSENDTAMHLTSDSIYEYLYTVMANYSSTTFILATSVLHIQPIQAKQFGIVVNNHKLRYTFLS